MTWTSPDWRANVLGWAAAQGFPTTGEPEPRIRPWSTTVRLPTADGIVWLKAAGTGTRFEPGLVQALHGYGAPHLLTPLAVDVDRGLLLLPDGGPTLRSVLDRDPDLRTWEVVLAKYAELQRSVEGRPLPGVDDQTPDAMPALLERLLASVPVEPLEQLTALQPRFATWCEELAWSGIAPTVQHDDLHDGNVFANHVFFDWGDAVFAHPFASLLVTLRSIAQRWSLEPGSPELQRIRDAYLEPWTDAHSRVELEFFALIATRVGKVGRAQSWLRALQDVDNPGEHAEAAPGWLEELLEPDVF